MHGDGAPNGNLVLPLRARMKKQSDDRDGERGGTRPRLHFAVAKATFVTPAWLQILRTPTMYL